MATKMKTKQETKAHHALASLEEAPDMRERMKELLENIEHTWYEFSVGMEKIYDEELYKAWGYADDEGKPRSGFRKYVEAELPIEYRLAMYRVQIGQAIKKHHLSKEKVTKLGGWTKFKEVTYLLKDNTTSSQVEKIFERVKDMSFRETQEFVRSKRLGVEEGELDFKTLSFRLSSDQAEVVESAVTTAMEMVNTENTAVGLEYVMADFLNNRNENPKHIASIKAELHIPKEAKGKVKQKERAQKQKTSATPKTIKINGKEVAVPKSRADEVAEKNAKRAELKKAVKKATTKKKSKK